ncbi:hypothetical protein V1527DRAFT_472895 [Lipomyces starkeyi]
MSKKSNSQNISFLNLLKSELINVFATLLLSNLYSLDPQLMQMLISGMEYVVLAMIYCISKVFDPLV